MSFPMVTNSRRGSPWFSFSMIWRRHPLYNIAMGIMADPEILAIAEYMLKLHPLDMENPYAFGGAEYFCDPDSVVAVATPESRELESIVYLPYLRWARNFGATDDYVVMTLHHNPEDGAQSILPQAPRFPLSIREIHRMHMDSELVSSYVTIKNHYNKPLDALYCYQDGAVLWFPDSNQLAVETLVEADSKSIKNRYVLSTIRSQGLTTQFDPRHGIMAGIGCDTPGALVGALPFYIGFHYHDNLASGNLIGLVTFAGKPVRPAHVLNEARSWGGLPVSPETLKNRAVTFVLKNLQPGESRTIRFYRMGRFLNRPLEAEDLRKFSEDFLRGMKHEAGRVFSGTP